MGKVKRKSNKVSREIETTLLAPIIKIIIMSLIGISEKEISRNDNQHDPNP